MYRLFSSREIINNFLVLVLPHLQQKNEINYPLLKQAYLNYLKELQPHCPYMDNNQMFHAGNEIEETLKNILLQKLVYLKQQSLMFLKSYNILIHTTTKSIGKWIDSNTG